MVTGSGGRRDWATAGGGSRDSSRDWVTSSGGMMDRVAGGSRMDRVRWRGHVHRVTQVTHSI